MSATYYAILTAVGEAKFANALATGATVKFSKMAVGDGGGAVPTPDRKQTKLVNEVRRKLVNQVSVDPSNASQIIIEQVIPEDEGGWWIREYGAYDDADNLLAVCNCAPSYKPQLAEGSGRTQTIRMVLIVTSTASVELKIDPSVVLATRAYADNAITVSMKAHTDAADPHPQYAKKTLVTQFIADAVDSHVGAEDPHPQYALKSKTPLVFSILDFPKQDIGPIAVAECGEIWIWSASNYFTGYRSPLCGRPLYGHTIVPLASEVDAVGGLLSKTDYARLWGYAQENNLVVPQATWDSNRGAHYFVDVSGTQFRIPDLRNMFLRFTGTDADTANARTLGSKQSQQIQSHFHTYGPYATLLGNGTSGYSLNTGDTMLQTQSAGGSETRPTNTSYAPRLHI